jgi:hypothetical protein
LSDEIGSLRIKNNRCQELIEIKHDYDRLTKTYKITRRWADVERRFIQTMMVQTENGWRKLVDVLPKATLDSIPEDEVEVEYK